MKIRFLFIFLVGAAFFRGPYVQAAERCQAILSGLFQLAPLSSLGTIVHGANTIDYETWKFVSKRYASLIRSGDSSKEDSFFKFVSSIVHEERRDHGKYDPHYLIGSYSPFVDKNWFKKRTRPSQWGAVGEYVYEHAVGPYLKHPDIYEKADPRDPVRGVTLHQVKYWMATLNFLSAHGDKADQKLLQKLFRGHRKGMVYTLPTAEYVQSHAVDADQKENLADTLFLKTDTPEMYSQWRWARGQDPNGTMQKHGYLLESTPKDGTGRIVVIQEKVLPSGETMPVQSPMAQKAVPQPIASLKNWLVQKKNELQNLFKQDATPVDSTKETSKAVEKAVVVQPKQVRLRNATTHSDRKRNRSNDYFSLIKWKADEMEDYPGQGEDTIQVAQRFMAFAVSNFYNTSVQPPSVTFKLVFNGKWLPTSMPEGFDRSSQMFWALMEKNRLSTRLPTLAIEYGRYMFLENLRRHSKSYREWDDQRRNWTDGLSTVSRLKLQENLNWQTKPLSPKELTDDPEALADPRASFVSKSPWARLAYDYEIAFGILFAATAMKNLDLPNVPDPMNHPFFEAEVTRQFDLESEETLGTPPKQISWENKRNPLLDDYSYLGYERYNNSLRPSIRNIWLNKLREAGPYNRTAILEQAFHLFVQEIERRHIEEANGLVLDSHMNFRIGESLSKIDVTKAIPTQVTTEVLETPSLKLQKPRSSVLVDTYVDLALHGRLLSQKDKALRDRGLIQENAGLCGPVCTINIGHSIFAHVSQETPWFEKDPSYLVQRVVELSSEFFNKDITKKGMNLDESEIILKHIFSKMDPELLQKLKFTSESITQKSFTEASFITANNEIQLLTVQTAPQRSHVIVLLSLDHSNQTLQYSDPNLPDLVISTPYKVVKRQDRDTIEIEWNGHYEYKQGAVLTKLSIVLQ